MLLQSHQYLQGIKCDQIWQQEGSIVRNEDLPLAPTRLSYGPQTHLPNGSLLTIQINSPVRQYDPIIGRMQ
jgi:hypothetical protein